MDTQTEIMDITISHIIVGRIIKKNVWFHVSFSISNKKYTVYHINLFIKFVVVIR
jgi:hypothetical protein